MKVVTVLFLACVSLFVAIVDVASNQEKLILRGFTPKIEMFPHSVYLVVHCMETWHCGASVINQRVLLTAGQCVYGCNRRWKMSGYMGHEELKKMRVVRKVAKYLIHRKYNHRNFVNDIALAYLKTDVPFGTNVKRVVIWTHFLSATTADLEVSVAGWGSVDQYEEAPSDRLKSVKQTKQPDSVCNGIFKRLDKEQFSTQGMMCTQDIDENRLTFGDAGSALMANAYTQLGIVSFKTTIRNDIIFYTNVTYYRKWITSNSKALFCHGKKNS